MLAMFGFMHMHTTINKGQGPLPMGIVTTTTQIVQINKRWATVLFPSPFPQFAIAIPAYSCALPFEVCMHGQIISLYMYDHKLLQATCI